MDSSDINAANQAIANLNTTLGMVQSANLGKKNRKWNEKMMQWQYEKSKEYLDYQNAINKQNIADLWKEYNSPEAQMRAFEQAGLNPNLIYGQTTGVGEAPGFTGSSKPDVTFNPYDSDWVQKGVAQLNDNMTLAMRMDAMREQALTQQALQEKYRSESARNDADTQTIIAELPWFKEKGASAKEYFDWQLQQQAQNYEMNRELIWSQKFENNLTALYGLQERMAKLRSTLANADLDETSAKIAMRQYTNMAIQEAYTTAKTQEALSQAGLNYSTAKRIQELLPGEKEGIQLDNDIKSVDFNFKHDTKGMRRQQILKGLDKIDAEITNIRLRNTHDAMQNDYLGNTGLLGNYGVLNPVFHGVGTAKYGLERRVFAPMDQWLDRNLFHPGRYKNKK